MVGIFWIRLGPVIFFFISFFQEEFGQCRFKKFQGGSPEPFGVCVKRMTGISMS